MGNEFFEINVKKPLEVDRDLIWKQFDKEIHEKSNQ
jgi:hypothetical protein